MREGKKGKHPNPGDPQSFHGVNACLCLFLHACQVRAWSLPALQSPVLTFKFLVPLQLAVLGGWARFYILLVQYSTYTANDERMKSPQGVEGIYWVMMGGASIRRPSSFKKWRATLKSFSDITVWSVLAG